MLYLFQQIKINDFIREKKQAKEAKIFFENFDYDNKNISQRNNYINNIVDSYLSIVDN